MIRNPFRQMAIRRFPSFHHEHDSYRWWVLGNIMLSTFMAVLMSTVVNGALPSMMNSLGVGLDTMQWVLTAYLLVFTVMLPLSAWLSERFGYKLIFLIALAMFTLGSLLCFVSWDFSSLLLARIIQGAGGGIITPLGMTLVTREFPPKQRGLAMGLWSIASGASSSFGPSIGGWLVDNFGWRSTFLINLPIGIVALFATLVIQREFRNPGTKKFDFTGFTLVAVFLVSLLLALTDANAAWNTGGWSSPFIIALLSIAVVSLIGFVTVELTVEAPLVDLRLLKSVPFALTNAVMFFLFLSLLGTTFILPLYLQNILGYSALMSGLVFLPTGIMMALFSPISGTLINTIGPKPPILAGFLILAISLYLNTFLDTNPASWLINVPLILRGIGFGLILTPLQVMTVSHLSPTQLAQGSSLINLIRQIGGSFGVAIFGMVLAQRNIFHQSVDGEGIDIHGDVFDQTAATLAHVLMQSGIPANQSGTLAGALIAQTVSKTAYIQAICDVFFIVALLSLICMIPLALIRGGKPRKPA
jgi:DHA2 family multidrug resistance protein